MHAPPRLETHREPEACQQLVDQHHQREHAKEVPEVEILRRVVLTHMGIPRAHDRQARINPVPQCDKPAHYAASWSTPITITLSPSNEYGGTSRL
jgi:hypothetical protein